MRSTNETLSQMIAEVTLFPVRLAFGAFHSLHHHRRSRHGAELYAYKPPFPPPRNHAAADRMHPS